MKTNTSTYHALFVIGQIIKQRKSIITDDTEKNILRALSNLINDTNPNSEIPLSIHEKLPIRRSAASLALIIYNHYRKMRQPIPDEVEQWRKLCHSDNEFAEIRNQWYE